MPRIKIIIGIIVIIVVVSAIYFGLLKREKPEYSLAKVERGNIIQSVSETGTIKKGEEINLSFENSGRIEKIYVKKGDEVKSGLPLAKLDTAQLTIQLAEAQAALEVAQVQLKKLLAGASAEEIKIAETSVSNAQISLQSARENLEDVMATAHENLNNAYQDALNVLDDAYLKIYNAFETARLIQLAYFTKNDQEGLKVGENKDKIENSLRQAKFYLDKAKADPKNENIDLALSEIKKSLEDVSGALAIIRQISEEPLYRDLVSLADKTSLDNQRININTALTNITNSQQTISSTKITNEANINTAQNQVLEAEGALEKTKNELSRIKSPPRQEDVDLYSAKVKQVEAQVNLLKNQIEEATLISPTAGQITKIHKKVGEIVQLIEPIFSFMPANPFQIEVDIYEEDIIKVKVGNPVDIKLTAFPEKIFKGKVISIDPAEKIIEGVVYYEVNIDFEKSPEELKPGMTADIVIKTAKKENVLIIPERAIVKKDDKVTVQVLKGKTLEEREIETGLIGSNDMVEVVSGLKEGEEIVIP